MDAQRLKIHLTAALNHLEIRKAIGSIEALVYAQQALEGLPETSLVLVRDHLAKGAKTRHGALGELERAFQAVVEERLSDVRKQDRKRRHNIE